MRAWSASLETAYVRESHRKSLEDLDYERTDDIGATFAGNFVEPRVLLQLAFSRSTAVDIYNLVS
jgi:hypothetical protein